MIKPEPGSQGKRLPAALSLDGGQEDLLLHPDKPKKPCTEMGIGAVLDRAGVSHSRLQQSIKPPVVFDKKFREHSRFPFLWLPHQPTPIMPDFTLRPP